MARDRLASLEAQHPEQFTDALIDYIPKISPRLARPDPLAPYCDILDRAPMGGLRVVFAAPPQHGKTVCAMHGIVSWIKRHPLLRHAYVTYGQERSERVASRTKYIAHRAGLDTSLCKQNVWAFPDPKDPTSEGGSIIWSAIDGALTGEPIDGVLLIDDPVKGRKEAESRTYRQHAIEWFDDVADNRVHEGASIIVMMTRWHPGDLSGLLIDRGWDYINLKAIADNDTPEGDDRKPGEALWPERRPLAELHKKRRTNAYSFASLHQGMPRPRGGTLFGDPHYYKTSELPTQAYRAAFGLDLAYTEKTRADWSVSLKLFAVGDLSEKGTGRVYVVGMERKQMEAPRFAQLMKVQRGNTRGKWYWHASGTEKGSAQFMKGLGVPVTVMTPPGDKFVTSLPTASLWNDGRILLPDPDEDDATPLEWVETFTDEVTGFTGVKDDHDDMVDALNSGVTALKRGSGVSLDSKYDRDLPATRM